MHSIERKFKKGMSLVVSPNDRILVAVSGGPDSVVLLYLLNKYKFEMRKWPHSRSFENIKYLAKTRGASVGCEAAEAFVLVRTIEK